MPTFYGGGEHHGVVEDDERTTSEQGDGHEYIHGCWWYPSV